MTNIRSFIRKRQFSNKISFVSGFLKKFGQNLFKLAFAKRQILFVTNQKIRTISFGPFAQLCIFLSIAWVANLFYQSLQYNKIISAKSQEIARLKNMAIYFEAEFSNMNDKLQKVNEYLIDKNGEEDLVSEEKQEIKMPNNLKNDISQNDENVVEKIQNAQNEISKIDRITNKKIAKIEKAIEISGLNLNKKQNQDIAELIKKYPKLQNASFVQKKLGSGGPFISIEEFEENQAQNINFFDEKLLNAANFVNKVDYLITLEKLTQFMPLSKPIKNYSVSSGFGRRIDPITKTLAVHQGLDFVGPNNEKIISPSSGKVILAGGFSDYGNAVVIDHGFGITTRYGHLSKVLVKEGQIVKKGDVIARQGNSGRSTGQHLHYEVRYKNIPLNPRKFLEAGEFLFNNSQKKYANS